MKTGEGGKDGYGGMFTGCGSETAPDISGERMYLPATGAGVPDGGGRVSEPYLVGN